MFEHHNRIAKPGINADNIAVQLSPQTGNLAANTVDVILVYEDSEANHYGRDDGGDGCDQNVFGSGLMC